jgi:hypothetical protein
MRDVPGLSVELEQESLANRTEAGEQVESDPVGGVPRGQDANLPRRLREYGPGAVEDQVDRIPKL